MSLESPLVDYSDLESNVRQALEWCDPGHGADEAVRCLPELTRLMIDQPQVSGRTLEARVRRCVAELCQPPAAGDPVAMPEQSIEQVVTVLVGHLRRFRGQVNNHAAGMQPPAQFFG